VRNVRNGFTLPIPCMSPVHQNAELEDVEQGKVVNKLFFISHHIPTMQDNFFTKIKGDNG